MGTAGGGIPPLPVFDTADLADLAEAAGPAWSATKALGRAVLVCCVLLLAAVLTGRYDLVVLAVPFAVGTAISLARRPEEVPVVEVAAIDPRFPEGGQVTAAVCVASSDRVRLDLVVVRLMMARWVRLRFGDRPYAATVARRATAEIPLRGRAVRWGRHALGPTVVHAVASDGLLISDALVAPELWLKVYPVIEPFAADEAMPRAAGLVGFHRSRKPGEGGELAGVRPFGPGDRLRRIDWRVSLRSRQLHVVSTLSDRDAEVALLLDVLHDAGRSGGIDGACSVLDTTVRAAAGIAEHYLQRGDRVSMLGNGVPARRVRAGSGRRQYLTILEWLMEVAPTGADASGAVLNPQLISPNALVIVLTPLLDPRSAQMLAALARSGRFVVAVDTFGAETPARGSGKWAEAANQFWRLERANVIDQLREHGVPVVAWAGSGSLDRVLQDVTRMAAAPKAAGR
ncbi:MAG: DUF58 domain-containing protein [Dactylosporangium sp.]|nr:DUF58 domain-containing protein [Dactylosporangium sp.]NNJ63695.1 DUF58 domain-containing protein [Dactylosporangium sp.]